MLRIRDPAGIQTPTLLIRSQMLYSVKLRDHLLYFGFRIFDLGFKKTLSRDPKFKGGQR